MLRIDVAAAKPSAFAWVGALHVGDVVAWRCCHQHAEASQAIVCARNARLIVAPRTMGEAVTIQAARQVAKLWRRRG